MKKPAVNWSQVTDQYLDQNPDPPDAVRQVLQQIRESGPSAISRAVDPEVAEAAKVESTKFLLYIIGEALTDRALTETEIGDLRVLRRAFRIEEGELVQHHAQTVSELLCREAELIYKDSEISPTEAVHKAQLQEVFGLGYDDFIEILEPEINRLTELLIARIVNGTLETWLRGDWNKVRDRLTAVSLVRHFQGSRRPDPTRSGYIYLLMNPSIPDMVKVGRTSHPPTKRAAELGGTTGVPTPFTVVFELFVADQFAAEAYVHRTLAEQGARVSENREFFAVEPSDAIHVMMEAREQR